MKLATKIAVLLLVQVGSARADLCDYLRDIADRKTNSFERMQAYREYRQCLQEQRRAEQLEQSRKDFDHQQQPKESSWPTED